MTRLRNPRLDYAIVLLSIMVRDPMADHSAKGLSTLAFLPRATVKRVLGVLVQDGLLASRRGARGGYRLAVPVEEITLARVISAFDRTMFDTACMHAPGRCPRDMPCPVRPTWRRVSAAIEHALDAISFADMIRTDGTATEIPAPLGMYNSGSVADMGAPGT